MLDPNDGGYRSRKLWFAIGTSASIVALGVLAAWKLPALAPMLETLVGGLLGVLAIICGANLGSKLIVGKTMATTGTSKAALVEPDDLGPANFKQDDPDEE